jgi:hypothetical protein
MTHGFPKGRLKQNHLQLNFNASAKHELFIHTVPTTQPVASISVKHVTVNVTGPHEDVVPEFLNGLWVKLTLNRRKELDTPRLMSRDAVSVAIHEFGGLVELLGNFLAATYGMFAVEIT